MGRKGRAHRIMKAIIHSGSPRARYFSKALRFRLGASSLAEAFRRGFGGGEEEEEEEEGEGGGTAGAGVGVGAGWAGRGRVMGSMTA